jgi:hypothetical protein
LFLNDPDEKLRDPEFLVRFTSGTDAVKTRPVDQRLHEQILIRAGSGIGLVVLSQQGTRRVGRRVRETDGGVSVSGGRYKNLNLAKNQ